jgi:hypothetical protein
MTLADGEMQMVAAAGLEPALRFPRSRFKSVRCGFPKSLVTTEIAAGPGNALLGFVYFWTVADIH